MNVVLWVLQVVVALSFLMAGTMKLTQPLERLAQKMGWVKDFPPAVVRGIGLLEVLGAVGLVLPAATGILPWLTPLAASGLVLTMIGAALTHARRHEYPMIAGNAVLLALALVVAVARFAVLPA